MMTIIPTIITQHAEETSFLWLQRNAAVNDPHYSLKDLAHLDDRVEAHIDGLRIAGDAGWAICKEALAIGEPGEVFSAAVLAFESEDGYRVDEVIAAAQEQPENRQALVSALGWVDEHHFERWAPGMANASRSIYRYLAIAGYAIRRIDPGDLLESALHDSDIAVQARALRAAGELKRHDLLTELKSFYQADDANCRFWSAWSGGLLEDPAAITALEIFVTPTSAYREPALQLLLRAMELNQAQALLSRLSRQPDTQRIIVQGVGILGNPTIIPWLIDRMSQPELARIAGEAFSMITGVDLAFEDLDGEWPEGFEAGPTENPDDDDVAMEPDADLPWPEQSLLQAWWEKHQSQFEPGRRYLVGQLISVQHCQSVLVSGYQRQRRAAAMELSLIQPEAVLFNTSAPGFKQQC